VSSASDIANKTSALEERLDGIVQMLQRSQAPQAMATLTTEDNLQNDSQNNIASRAGNEGTNYLPAQHPPPTPAASSTSGAVGKKINHSGGANSPSYYAGECPLETEKELNECLEHYRNKMVPYFPIIPISLGDTVQDLREERPCKLTARHKILFPFLFFSVKVNEKESFPIQFKIVSSMNSTIASQYSLRRDVLTSSLTM
jgi:hypothetical protein